MVYNNNIIPSVILQVESGEGRVFVYLTLPREVERLFPIRVALWYT